MLRGEVGAVMNKSPPRSTPVQSPCAALGPANRALLTLASSSDAGRASADFYPGLRAATVCKATQHGVWAIELSSLETDPALGQFLQSSSGFRFSCCSFHL